MGNNRSINQSGAVIPQDWHESNGGWAKVTFFIPDSFMWRVTVISLIDLLGQGRFWRSDGPRKAQNAQAIEIIDVIKTGRFIREFVMIKPEEYLLAELKTRIETEYTLKTILIELRQNKAIEYYITKPGDPTPQNPNPFIHGGDDSLLSCLCNEAETEQMKRIADSVSNMQKQIETNNQCLLATQQAINKILGGQSTGGCEDSSIPQDCQPTATTWDGVVYIADETVSIVETFGSYLATPIVNFLLGARWFTRALLAVGLAEPSPTEELVTVPLAGVVEAITQLVETAIDMGTSSAREAVDELKANRNGDVDKLCRADEATIDDTLDDIIDTVKDVFSDPQVQQNIKNLLDGFFKAPPVKVILTK